MSRAVAIRHVAFEDLGVFEAVLGARGYDVSYLEAGVDNVSAFDAFSAELVIVLGGPIGVYDAPLYPFLDDEIRLIERRLAARAALLGICLGAQLNARAAGAKVYPGPAKEIGFAPVTLTPEGEASCLAALADARHMVLHWHGDTFDLPAGAARLSSTALTPNQAFSLGANVLALQFHIEVDPRRIETWLVGHACELAHAKIDIASLRADAKSDGPAVDGLEAPR
jgi:GMP synthase (glutamine-hydrolysing)